MAKEREFTVTLEVPFEVPFEATSKKEAAEFFWSGIQPAGWALEGAFVRVHEEGQNGSTGYRISRTKDGKGFRLVWSF